jgi:hypothetical protein
MAKSSPAALKFAWMARVAEDPRLSDTRRLILIYCALQYVKSGELTFCVRQQTVANNLGMRRQTVGYALLEARKLGWLRSYERQRGRGYYQGDVHEITLPDEIGTPGGTYSEEYVRPEDQIGTRGGPEDVRVEAQNMFVLRQSDQAECDPYKGVIQGGSTGYKSQGVASAFDHLFDRSAPPVQPPLLAPVRELETTVIDAEEVPDPDAPQCVIDGCDKPGTDEFDGMCGWHHAHGGDRRRRA